MDYFQYSEVIMNEYGFTPTEFEECSNTLKLFNEVIEEEIMSVDIINMVQCASISNFRMEIPSSTGNSNYIVTHGPTPFGDYQYGWECNCKGFSYRKTCSHIEKAKKEFCGYHEQFDHEHYNGSGDCPRCGKKVESIRVAV